VPFIPHTDADVAAMLATIGAQDIESLFDEIPGYPKGHRVFTNFFGGQRQGRRKILTSNKSRDIKDT